MQNQNASLNSAAEALKKQSRGFEDIPEKELSETMEYLETEKAETSKLREKIHSSWHNNQQWRKNCFATEIKNAVIEAEARLVRNALSPTR